MAVNIWRNFINKPRLSNDIFPTVEIGYSHYGPTFAIAGTLDAINSIVLINNICVEITNKNKKTSYFMDWFAFRPTQHVMGNFSEINLTMTSKFTITPNKAYNYNLLFIDNGRFSQMKALLQAIKGAWAEYLVTIAKEKRFIRPETLFPDFIKLPVVLDAAERLKTITCWEQGCYLIKIRITTKNPKQIFSFEKYFTLTPSDEQTLANNALNIIANICQQPHNPYNCATVLLSAKK